MRKLSASANKNEEDIATFHRQPPEKLVICLKLQKQHLVVVPLKILGGAQVCSDVREIPKTGELGR